MRWTPLCLFAISILWSGIGKSGAAGCIENADFYQSLPAVIGKEDQIGKFLFPLNCDTVFVRKGITTTVYPGTMLYFTQPTLNSVIKVEGTLLIKGTKNSYVSLSGSVDSTRNGIEAGNRQWGGIEVAEGGRLEVEFAGFMKAPTPITAFSSQVKLTNTWFKGSSGMILSDGTLYPMESSWQAINNLDLSVSPADTKVANRERPPDPLSEKEKQELLDHQGLGLWTWPKVAGGAALLAAFGVGASLYLAPEKVGPKTTKQITTQGTSSGIDPIPKFPPE